MSSNEIHEFRWEWPLIPGHNVDFIWTEDSRKDGYLAVVSVEASDRYPAYHP